MTPWPGSVLRMFSPMDKKRGKKIVGVTECGQETIWCEPGQSAANAASVVLGGIGAGKSRPGR